MELTKKRKVMHLTLSFALDYCPVLFFIACSQFVGDFHLGMITLWQVSFFEYALIVPVIALKYTFLETIVSQFTTRVIFMVLSKFG